MPPKIHPKMPRRNHNPSSGSSNHPSSSTQQPSEPSTLSSTSSHPPKRANKNRPIEISSKKPVSRIRPVIPIHNPSTRDPRFSNNLSGKFNKDLFTKSYNFLSDLQSSERVMMKKSINEMKDPIEKRKLMNALAAIEEREKANKIEENRQEIKRVWKKTEMEAIKDGKKKNPYYLKESDIKRLELVQKYQGLKDKDLDKILEKRRKRNATKEHRFLPYQRG